MLTIKRLVNFLQKKLFKTFQEVTGQRAKGNGEFSKRMKHRNRIFWQAPDAARIKSTYLQATDPLEKWRDTENWQRKLSNKHNSREFAKMLACRVPDLYWEGSDIAQINFDALPAQYIIRPTVGHSCALVFLMDNQLNLMDGRHYTNQEIKEKLRQVVQNNLRVGFLIEEFLKTEQGEYKIPDDFKFYFFNGELVTIQVINRKGRAKGTTKFYNANWQVMKNINTNYPVGAYQAPPRCLPEMMAQAKNLSKAYEIFVRIDFYATDQGAVFGEFTPTPAVGDYFTTYGDKLLIEYWDKYCPGKI